jgi:hypothetical protein
MALRVPVIEMLDEAFAVGLRGVVLGILDRRVAEQAPPLRTAPQIVRVVDRVPCFVAENAQACLGITTLHFQHLRQLQPSEAWMREIKGNGDAGDAVGREPFVGKVVMRSNQAAGVELGVDLRDARFELRPLDGQAEVAHADLEQLVVAETGPVGRLQRLAIGGSCFDHSVSRS